MPIGRDIERSQGWHRRLTVPQFTVVTGLLVVLIGTLLLATPLCSSSRVGLWEALFTATSAITVTGLSIIDIGSDLTTFGQAVLALMILAPMAAGLVQMAISRSREAAMGNESRTRWSTSFRARRAAAAAGSSSGRALS